MSNELTYEQNETLLNQLYNLGLEQTESEEYEAKWITIICKITTEKCSK
ncbi:hypothetical protein [Mycoplasma crocodyli]|uniref:Uncharacterized protein n=1 Tax=Mycoplasma crocodyli (strain ATCC 51981 / MP145) TaxID=512564 RepID=D5E5T1_MYCCM|nr:hypothetical protein [Mycoplasma crocodyli]ADE19711.1 hypothetical protein MCRO_0501 [Mycoplasma crocodyli MP145]